MSVTILFFLLIIAEEITTPSFVMYAFYFLWLSAVILEQIFDVAQLQYIGVVPKVIWKENFSQLGLRIAVTSASPGVQLGSWARPTHRPGI